MDKQYRDNDFQRFFIEIRPSPKGADLGEVVRSDRGYRHSYRISWLFTMLGMTQNDVASAYGGSIGESLGFFGVMISREIAADRSKARRRLESYGWKGMHRTIRGLFMEFGPAELLDTGLIGPLAMGTASYYLGPGIGILVGKLASDLAFSCWLSPKAPSPCSRPPSCAKSRLRKRRNPNSSTNNTPKKCLCKQNRSLGR